MDPIPLMNPVTEMIALVVIFLIVGGAVALMVAGHLANRPGKSGRRRRRGVSGVGVDQPRRPLTPRKYFDTSGQSPMDGDDS